MQKEKSKRVLKSILFLALLVAVVTGNKSYAKAEVNGSIKALKIFLGDEEPKEENIYNGKMVTAASGKWKTSIVEITTECSGLLSITYEGKNTKNLNYTLYSDQANVDVVESYYMKPSEKAVNSNLIEVTKAGTYYLKLSCVDEVDIDYTINVKIVSAEDEALIQNQYIRTALLSSEDENYYKLTLKKSGVLKFFTAFENGEECDIDVDIYKSSNGENKLVSRGSAAVDGKVYGLVKGTYYIKLSNGDSDIYKIAYRFASLTNKSGSKKSKAKAISFKKRVDGLFLVNANSSKEHWYKFVNSKPRKIVIALSGEIDGGVSMEFYGTDGDSFGTSYIDEYKDLDANIPYFSSNYGPDDYIMPKGTYYMKVTKDSDESSGYYSIIIESVKL